MRILALDIATTVGWAAGDSAGRPSFGIQEFYSGGRDIGRLLNYYARWLDQMIEFKEPDLVMFEKPLLFASRGQPEMTLYKLICMAGETERVCGTRKVKPQWVPINTLKKHFTGNGRAKKPEMIEVARQLGYQVTDGNQADAIAVFSYAVTIHDPEHAHQWTRVGSAA